MTEIALKEPLSYEKQLQKLKEHNLIIEDEHAAIEFLKEVNYYRFTGYMIQFRLSPNDSRLNPRLNVTFSQIVDLCKFDYELRNLLQKYLGIVERYIRSLVSYYLSREICIDTPYDQHYDYSLYSRPKEIESIFEKVKKNKKYFSNTPVIDHYIKRYNGKFPLWVIVEDISFSSLSKLFFSMPESAKSKITDVINPGAEAGYQTLENHLWCLSILRNRCAHLARLYNSKFSPPVKFNKGFLRKYPEVKNDSLFAYILALARNLPTDVYRESFITDICELMDRYLNVIDFDLISFPQNYKDVLYKESKLRTETLLAYYKKENARKDEVIKEQAYLKLLSNGWMKFIKGATYGIHAIALFILYALQDFVKNNVIATQHWKVLWLVFFYFIVAAVAGVMIFFLEKLRKRIINYFNKRYHKEIKT